MRTKCLSHCPDLSYEIVRKAEEIGSDGDGASQTQRSWCHTGITTFAQYIGGSESVLSHIGSLVEDLGNRRMGEDLMADLIERHALGDRQTSDGDDLGCGVAIDLHPENPLRLGMVEDLEESGGALIIGYLVHD